jgi:diguanylate cyclase (GGDEF)-like protein
MSWFARLLPPNLLQPSSAKAQAKSGIDLTERISGRPGTSKSIPSASRRLKHASAPSKTLAKVTIRGASKPTTVRPIPTQSVNRRTSIRLEKAALILAMLICTGSIMLCLNISLSGDLFSSYQSPPLQASLEAEKGNLLVQKFVVPAQQNASMIEPEARMLLIDVALGAAIKSLRFASTSLGNEHLGPDRSSELLHGGHGKAIALPPNTREIQLTTQSGFMSQTSLRIGTWSAYQKARTNVLMVTIAVMCAQALLALFACTVAYFGRLKVMGWFSWWLITLSVVTLVTSGALGALIDNSLAAKIEPHLIGAVASIFGLATMRLEQAFSGISTTVALASRRWFGIWLITLGLTSAAYPHPFVIGLIWASGVAYCLAAAFKQIMAVQKSALKLRTLTCIVAWSIGTITILGEILPWFGAFFTKTGYNYLFPTLYSAAFTTYAMSRALGLERASRRNAQKVAEASLKHVADVVENTPVAMLSANYKGRLMHANVQAREIWPSLDWSATNNLMLDDLVGPQYADLLSGAFHSKESVDAVVTLPKGEHRPKEIICQLKIFRTATTIELTLINITDQERMTRVLENQVSTDPLTRLLNRRGLDQHLRALQTLVNKNEANASLLFIDLDRFKIVNDLYGHDYGDELLIQIALRARAMSEGRLTIARIGGDEFVVLAPNASLDLACDLAEELRSVISNRPYPVRDKLLTVGASIGVIRLAKGMEPKDALIYADRACGQAKKNGRGRVERIEASDKLIHEFKSESILQELMSSRLPTERLRIYAQPLVPLSGRTGLAYEVLLRYVDENEKVLPPGQLISIAERQGLMSQLDFWVLESTLKFLDQNARFALTSLFFTVNLSGSSINDRRFLSDILKLFDRHAKVAHRITLEITETVALLDSKYTRRFMDAMIAKGVRFALDDFGAGYTSFGYLKDLPADMLKIDGNFIATLSQDIPCQRIVRTMSTLSQQLGMQSVAEWVEDEKTLVLLIAMQIDFAQGYFFSPAEPIEHWAESQTAIDEIQEKAQRYTRPAPSPSPAFPPQVQEDLELTALV